MTPPASLACPVLVFDRSDPTAAGGLQGALLSLAARGCLPLSVITAIGCGDTRGVEHVHLLDPEWIVEQARPVLEDMQLRAVFVGDPGSLESLGAIAEIAADYEAPLVFAPGDLREAADPDESEDLAAASIELLMPQATVVVLDATSAQRLVSAGTDEGEGLTGFEAAQVLIECGAAFVLLGDGRDAAHQAVDILIGAGGVVRTLARPAPERAVSGALQLLAAALCAGLAQGHSVEDAFELAHGYLGQSLEAALRPGMGAPQTDPMAALRRGLA